APGDLAGRPVNQTGASADMAAEPRALSHVVYFVPDAARAEAFYQRLGFVCTDRFTHVGPFLRPAGPQAPHTRFLLPAPPLMPGS
ncbi:glyoxalase, partial [Staphylococcus warneri]